MTDDLKKLAEAAKAATAAYIANPTDRETGRQWDRACAEFSLACTEDAILALIRERDEAREHNQRTVEALEFDVERLAKERDEAREEVERLRNAPRIEFHQQDWLEGFAAFVENATTPPPESRAFCLLNLGAFLATVEHGHVEKAELPYFIAESMMHEVVHALEQWAGVEFSEERVEALLVKYRAATLTKEPHHV